MFVQILKYGAPDVHLPLDDADITLSHEDIGVQSTEQFILDESYGLTLKYTSKDNLRYSCVIKKEAIKK